MLKVLLQPKSDALYATANVVNFVISLSKNIRIG